MVVAIFLNTKDRPKGTNMLLTDIQKPLDELMETINHTYYMHMLVSNVERGIAFQRASELAAMKAIDDSISIQVEYLRENKYALE